MRFLRFTFLLEQIRTSKNLEKFALFINIGIFFSIFAITSALITFFVEIKINKFQLERNKIVYEKRNTDKELEEITDMTEILFKSFQEDLSTEQIYNYLNLTKIGEIVITTDDTYLPQIYLNLQILEMSKRIFNKENLNIMIDEVRTYFSEESSGQFLVDQLEKSSGNIIKNFEELDLNKYKKLSNKVFNYSNKDIIQEILDEDGGLRGPIWNDRKKILEMSKNLYNFLEDYQIYLGFLSSGYKEDLLNTNKKIKKYSEMESYIILIAFMFQIILFIIIQFFEIKTTETTNINNAKRKTK